MPADRRATRTIRVGLDARSYDVVIGAGILGTLGPRVLNCFGHDPALPARPPPSPPNSPTPAAAATPSASPDPLPPRPGAARRAFLAVDGGLPPEAAAAAQESLAAAGYRVSREPIPAGEEAKSFSSAERLLVALAASRQERADPLIALGGGATGDLAGFAAALYRRGIPLIGCPTTLLAMVDASVGGKTAVNLSVPAAGPDAPTRLLKNLVGAFHQPSLVVCDVRMLATLPDPEFRSGLAECIKHGLLSADWHDPDLLDWTVSSLTAILDRDESYLIELVARNVKIKAAVVGADEREEGAGPGGGRLALNMGHTVAHAIETLPLPEGSLKHGEAVGLGLIAEAAGGERMGVTTRGCADRITEALKAAGLPTAVRGLPSPGALVERMLDDKKTSGGRLRLALPTGDGRCRVVIDPPLDAVRAGIERIRG